MGLPPCDRYPEATVTLSAETLTVSFAGEAGERRSAVPLALLADGVDAEEASLHVMARLKEMGYTVRYGGGRPPP
jgi:hypothetical protein